MSVSHQNNQEGGNLGFDRSQRKSGSSTGYDWLINALLLCLILTASGTGTYLLMAEDIETTQMVEKTRMQQAYEDKIANLRTQVDVISSRKLLDQRTVELKLQEILERQKMLEQRKKYLSETLKRAQKFGALDTPPTGELDQITTSGTPSVAVTFGALAGSKSAFDRTDERSHTFTNLASISPTRIDAVERSLELTEQSQIAKLRKATDTTLEKSKRLAAILTKQGLSLPENSDNVGGPLVELKTGDAFLNRVNELEAAIERLNSTRKLALSLPQGSPTPGQKISSRYGSRKDPFTGRRAIHGGLDFRAKKGVPVLATAAGRVTKAGRHGGYGKLVEIDHGNGLTTRYAHLSRIHVQIGQHVSIGKIIGKVGSTGRSTGPHLHYEVRRKGQTVNPLNYVKLARDLRPFLR